MGFKGSVTSFSLADVFQNLAMNQHTGTLTVVASENRVSSVYFQSGTIQAVARGSGECLPSLKAFYARGYIDRQRYIDAGERMKSHRENAPSALQALNFVTQEQVEQLIRLRVEEETFELFSWEDAQFEFTDGAASPDLFDPKALECAPSLPIAPMIMEAARRVDEWERLKSQLPSAKDILILDAAARRAIEHNEMELEPAERHLALLCDGTRDIEDVIADSGLYRFEVMNMLAGFIQSSVVRPTTPEELGLAEQEAARQNLPLRRIKILERLLAQNSDNLRVRRELAELLARERRVENACVHFAILADHELKSKKEDGAIELYKRMLELSPKSVKAHERLAEIYSKRGQKREALTHYTELFDTYKDQHHLKEARAAAVCALDCDPSNSQLRGDLIDMLLSENMKEDAARQYEALGDQLSKSGNVKAAADAYRRAMQQLGNNRTLMKKLSDVMLTREDRVRSRGRAVVVLIVLLVLGLAAGGVALLEYRALRELENSERIATPIALAAHDAELQERYEDALRDYTSAASRYSSAANRFSPFMGYAEKARQKQRDLATLAENASAAIKRRHATLRQQAIDDLKNGLELIRTPRAAEALPLLRGVISNPMASVGERTQAAEGLKKIEAEIGTFESGLAMLRRDPNTAFDDIYKETAFKAQFIRDFGSSGRIKRSEIELPVQVRTDTDGVNVFLNGKLAGSVNIGADRASSTFRYPAEGVHFFEFKRKGYATISFSTAELTSPLVDLKMRREAVSRLDARRLLPADVTFSGKPALYNGGFLCGASDGSLLYIHDAPEPLKARHTPPGGTQLNSDVYGDIFVLSRAGKPDLIVYCTRGGTVVGLTFEGGAFKPAFNPIAGSPVQLTAPPSILQMSLFGGKPMLALPADRRVYLADLDSGVRLPEDQVPPFAARISAPVLGVETDNLLVAACQNGRVYGVSLSGQAAREWSTGADTIAVRSAMQMFEGSIVAPADNGSVYFFAPQRAGLGERLNLDGGPLNGGALIVKRRIYAGSMLKEGLVCGDLVARRPVWRKVEAQMGSVKAEPAFMDGLLYFNTDAGKLFAVDAERGNIRWSYAFDGGRALTGSPLVLGKRIYAVSASGLILGFEE